MTRKAKILNGAVDSISLAPETDPSWIDCDDDVFAGHLYDGSVFTAPPPPPPLTQAELDAAADATLDEHFGADASEDSQVRNLMAADVLMGIDNRLTKTTALVQVRANYEAHLRAIRGL